MGASVVDLRSSEIPGYLLIPEVWKRVCKVRETAETVDARLTSFCKESSARPVEVGLGIMLHVMNATAARPAAARRIPVTTISCNRKRFLQAARPALQLASTRPSPPLPQRSTTARAVEEEGVELIDAIDVEGFEIDDRIPVTVSLLGPAGAVAPLRH